MLSKAEKTTFRAELFRHLDGIATAPTAFALYEKGILDFLLEKKEADLKQLTDKFKANEGYLNVALRILCSQGWLDCLLDNENNSVSYQINSKSETAFSLCSLYEDVVHLMKFSGQFHPRKFERAPFLFLKQIVNKYEQHYGIEFSGDPEVSEIQEQVLKHIEGYMVGPTVVALGMGGMFHKYFMEASFKPEEFHEDVESFGNILDMFSHLGWFRKKKGTYSFTEKGLFYAKRASAYGVTVSYIPMFRNLEELIFGDPGFLWNVPKGAPEIHVDREMNVWGSGGAHTTYFKKIDEIIMSIFNRPIHQQPKGIVDMGCGNGAFLEHLFDVIDQRTLRGQMLEDYPLFLVGADFNEAALKVTRANLIKADVWAKVIWGDIGRPDVLANDLKEDYGIDLQDLLNVRTFLDHNRQWQDPSGINTDRLSGSTGAFAFRGRRIGNNTVEESLLEHFNKWAPYVSKFGLLVIELHTLDPVLTANNIGRIPTTAYDATHGYSDQYIVEAPIFKKIAAEAGLYPVDEFSHLYPNQEMPTVSINLLKEKGYA